MPAGARFRLSKSAIREIAVELQRSEDAYFAKGKSSRDSAWTESDFSRDVYYSLKREDDDLRGKKTVATIAKKLGKLPYQIVRLVYKEEERMSPNEYFDALPTLEERNSKISDALEDLKTYDRDFIEAVIGLLQEPDFETSRAQLVTLATGGYGIAKKKLEIDDESIVEIAQSRKKKRRRGPLGLGPTSLTGVINLSFIQKIDASVQSNAPLNMPPPALYDLAFALKVLPSTLVSKESPAYELFIAAENAAIAKLDQ